VKFRHNSHYGKSPNAYTLFYKSLFLGKGENIMKKLVSTILLTLLTIALAFSTACDSKPLVVKDSEHLIVISVTEDSIKDSKTLIDYMHVLKSDNELEFEIANGMITSINNIDNPKDYSYCWMLYTSDTTLSNSDWGTIDYKGVIYGSAVVGAELLEIKPNNIYIWYYQKF
jgi:hypothetical protein